MKTTGKLIKALDHIDSYRRFGKVSRVVGLCIESRGPRTFVGDVCRIYLEPRGRTVAAEVIGFQEGRVLLMPFATVNDIAPGCLVEATGEPLQISVGPSLIGKVLNALGEPLDSPFSAKEKSERVFVEKQPPHPLRRPRIRKPLALGVRAIDGLLAVGKGQRMGIFSGSGVGKSTLLGMIARHTAADVNVIALVGERGREVREFIERDLGSAGRKRSVVVYATSDQPALLRIKAAQTATAIAEYFRDLGHDVLFMMDSVTRVAMAQREIGLAAGEPPTTKGYPPSVFARLPGLLERTGTNENGSITAFYSVLVDGDDLDEPIADAVRGILDGHIVLSRRLADSGHFPAIDILKSTSRLMNDIVGKQQQKAARRFRELLATYRESEDLLNIGAYKQGSSRKIDRAVRLYPQMLAFLRQETSESISYDETVHELVTRFGEEAEE